jgi:hypothetical protein
MLVTSLDIIGLGSRIYILIYSCVGLYMADSEEDVTWNIWHDTCDSILITHLEYT